VIAVGPRSPTDNRALPDAPGFGVAFDTDFIKAYRVN
jgi:hypothetical protein